MEVRIKWLELFIISDILCRCTDCHDTSFCDDKVAGHYKDIADCSFYYQCDAFQGTHHRPCPPSLFWSDTSNGCSSNICESSDPETSSVVSGEHFKLIKTGQKPILIPLSIFQHTRIIQCALYCVKQSGCSGFSMEHGQCTLWPTPPDAVAYMIMLDVKTWCLLPNCSLL